MIDSPELENTIRRLLASQPLAVLATQDKGQPYTSLVTVASSEDLKYLLFPTLRATHKYTHIAVDGRVALLVDNRSTQEADSPDAMALTVIGTAAEVEEDEREGLLQHYLARHPHLEEFVSDPNCALVKVQVDCYRLVRKFQDVAELNIRQPNGSVPV